MLRAVDEQLVSPDTRYVAETHRRLLSEGHDDLTARTHIANCLAKELYEMVREKRKFDSDAYRADLERLPFDEDTDENGELIPGFGDDAGEFGDDDDEDGFGALDKLKFD